MRELIGSWSSVEAWLAGDGAPAMTVALWSLAWIFAIAGIAKIRRPVPAAFALADFRVTKRVRPAAAATLGAIEIALAIAIAFHVAPRAILLVTVLLLAAFSAAIAAALVRGERFTCYCFGAGEAISAATLARTALLSVVALGALLAGEHVAVASLGDRVLGAASGLVLVSAAAILGKFGVLLRMNGGIFTVAAR